MTPTNKASIGSTSAGAHGCFSATAYPAPNPRKQARSVKFLKNENTGKTITENVTGSGKATVNPDGSLSIRQEGHLGLITLEAADAERFGLPPLGVIGGVLFEELAPDGTYTSVTMQGHLLVDICAALS